MGVNSRTPAAARAAASIFGPVLPTSEPSLQDAEHLDALWADPDPWGYEGTADDEMRVARLITYLPRREYERTLDIGCGNGYLTAHLPGAEIVGVDVSERALAWAEQRVDREPPGRFTFRARSIFDLDPAELGTFDLVVAAGVLYPQYVGNAFAVAVEAIRSVLRPGAIVASAHVDDLGVARLPFTSLDATLDAYREHSVRLEIYQAGW
jgi:SAM-dependent methyltransferase